VVSLIIDTATAQKRPPIHPIRGDYTSSLAFSPTGTLETGTVGGNVQGWDPISSRALSDPLPVAADPVAAIAFDPTGQRVATTSSQDGTVKLFSTSTLEQQGITLTTDQGAASSARFGPHGNGLIVVDDLGDGFTLPTAPSAWEQQACDIAGRNLTRQEWDLFLPGQSYTRTCP
jgi:WD40 repeat protein